MKKYTFELKNDSYISAYIVELKKESDNDPETIFYIGKRVTFPDKTVNNVTANVTLSELEFKFLISEILRVDPSIFVYGSDQDDKG